MVQSIGMSPGRQRGPRRPQRPELLPGDVMATINTSTNAITSTVNLETGSDTMGQLVSDGTLGLRLGHRRDQRRRRRSEPESRRLGPGQPALRHGRRRNLARSRTTQTLGPPPTEQAWNDAALLLGGRRRGRHLEDVHHAGVPAGARHGQRQQRDPLRERGRRLPRDPRRVGRCRPEQRLRHVRHRRTAWTVGRRWAGPAAPRRCGRPCSPSSPRPTATRPATAR